ncbi:MAG: hypothetical protein O7B35_15175 [Deltaproteobacteria bacterium]|nr:hypothetical protein [Deltaproteobacteria bacterium]
MAVEVAFEPIERREQLRDRVEMEPIDRLSLDRAAGPLDEAVRPGMVDLRERVADLGLPRGLREGVELARPRPPSAPVGPQRELPAVVGEDPVEAEGVEPLAVGQERQRTGRLAGVGDLRGQQPGRPVDGDEEVAPLPVEPGQVEHIDMEEARGTGPELAPPALPRGAKRLELVELQAHQLPVDRGATQLREDGLAQRQPDRVEIHQPVLPQPAQDGGRFRRQGLVEALGPTGAIPRIAAAFPSRDCGYTDAQLLGLESVRFTALANPLALVDRRASIGMVSHGVLLAAECSGITYRRDSRKSPSVHNVMKLHT